MSGEALLIAVAVGTLWLAGHETVKGMKKMDHAIAKHFHRKPPSETPQQEGK